MLDILLPFGLIIMSGVALRRIRPSGFDPDLVRQAVNACVLNLFLPALCVKTLYQSEINLETFLVPVAAGIATLTALVIAGAAYALLGKRMRIDAREKGVLLLASAFGNVTYLGLPVLSGLFGPGAAKYALFYDLLATTPILWFVGASLAARYGEGKRLALRESLRAVASLPPVWAILLGMLLREAGVPLPGFLLRTMEMLGGLVVPLMIFSIGLALSVPKVAHAYAVVPAVVIKLAVAPAVAFFTAKALGLEGVALASCGVEGGMPTMVLSLLVAARFKLDESLSAFTIVVTTVLSFFTLPVVIYLINAAAR